MAKSSSSIEARFDEAAREINAAMADLKLAKAGRRDYQRFGLILDALSKAREILHEVGDELDIYGTRERAEREADRAKNSRRLPAPGQTEAQ